MLVFFKDSSLSKRLPLAQIKFNFHKFNLLSFHMPVLHLNDSPRQYFCGPRKPPLLLLAPVKCVIRFSEESSFHTAPGEYTLKYFLLFANHDGGLLHVLAQSFHPAKMPQWFSHFMSYRLPSFQNATVSLCGSLAAWAALCTT